MFEIQDNVPVPDDVTGRGIGTRGKYPFDKLAVGQSFFVPKIKMNSTIQSASRRLGVKLVSKVVTENGVEGTRIWREAGAVAIVAAPSKPRKPRKGVDAAADAAASTEPPAADAAA